jgi:predicted nucleic acid-binding protein
MYPGIRAFKPPTPRRRIWRIDKSVSVTANVQFILPNDLLIAGHAIHLLVVAAANDRISGFAAKLYRAVKASFLRTAIN